MEAPSSPASRDVARRLIEYIRTAGLTVGDRLPSIRELAAHLQVGTNVMRDALVQAQMMGVVRMHPRSGSFVQSLRAGPMADLFGETLESSLLQVDHTLFDLLDARRLIETELAGRAAERRRPEDLLPVREAFDAMIRWQPPAPRAGYVDPDLQFHLGIARIAGNPLLEGILAGLLGLTRPYILGQSPSAQVRAGTDRSHAAIYDALLQGDAASARAAMHAHLDLARQHLLDHVAASPYRQLPD